MWVSATLSPLPQMNSNIIHSKGLEEQDEMCDCNNSDVDDKKVVFQAGIFLLHDRMFFVSLVRNSQNCQLLKTIKTKTIKHETHNKSNIVTSLWFFLHKKLFCKLINRYCTLSMIYSYLSLELYLMLYFYITVSTDVKAKLATKERCGM